MAIFGTEAPEPVPEGPEKPVAAGIAELIEEAKQHYDLAQQYLKAGDWTRYGKELDALKEVLDHLAQTQPKRINSTT